MSFLTSLFCKLPKCLLQDFFEDFRILIFKFGFYFSLVAQVVGRKSVCNKKNYCSGDVGYCPAHY